MRKHKTKLKKTIQIILISIVGLIVISSAAVYLLLHNYIHKMNLVDIGTDVPKTEQQLTTENTAPNTPETGETVEIPADTANASEVMQNLQDQLGQLSEPSQGSSQEHQNQQVQQSPEQQSPPTQQSQSDNQYLQTQQEEQADQSGSNGKTPSEQPDPEEAVMLMQDKQVMNLLLIGSDAQSNDNSDYSDSIVLFTVNRKTKKLITTTLLNNIYLPIPGKGMNRIVTAFQNEGAKLLADTIEQNFRIKLDGYVMADYLTFFDIVDTIGGITVEVTNDELEPVNRNIREINKQLKAEPDADLLTGEGTFVFNGKQALGYSRNWFTDEGRFIRTGKQKEIILSIYDKVKKFNFIELNGFLNIVLPHITTDLSENEILELLFMLPVYFDYSLENLSIPCKGTEKRVKKEGKTVLDIDMEKNRSELYQRLFNIE